jgi:hypothetical protein
VEQDGGQYVFGFGSLIAATDGSFLPSRESDTRGYVADLVGYRRCWGVAMDNARDLAHYKYYVEKGEGGLERRPEIFVAFLDIVREPDSRINGLLRPVTNAEMSLLDARERNYRRIDVTDSIERAPGRVWAYEGRQEARQRRVEADAVGRLVVDAQYMRSVESGFAALGADELVQFRASTMPFEGTVMELERRAVTPGPASIVQT